MTEKRFKLGYVCGDYGLIDNDDVENKWTDFCSMSENSEKNVQICIRKMNELAEENEQLKKQLNDLQTFDDEDFIETEHINNIYKKLGFQGVIDYAKGKLQHYGAVREVEKGLWVMVTGGWSDNEFWLDCLNSLVSMFAMKHYCAYERGGAFYYTEKPHDKIEIRLKGDLE